MKVLMVDQFAESTRRAIAAIGVEVEWKATAKDDELVAAIAASGADVLVVRSTKVSAKALCAGTLGVVIRAGAGVNTIDVEAASARGIFVSNCPGRNSVAVAELTMALLLALDRRIPDNVADLRAGKWAKGEYGKARGVFGRTLGVVGVGSIGCEVVLRARAFGMPVVAWSRSLTDERAAGLGVQRAESPEAVAAASDALTVHLALTPETKGRIGASVFSAMRAGSTFINTSRAEVVEGAALAAAVREKGIRVGLDVFAREPAGAAGAFEDDVVKLAGVVYGTHHIGASTEQAQDAIADEVVRIIRAYKETGKVPNAVNLCRRSPATHLLAVRHLDRPGVLAGVLDTIRASGINVQEMENVVFDGAKAAVARIRMEGALPGGALAALRANADIIEASLIELR
ncbi:MAG: hydroxyacid dehydrogenase [Deltaproteobacteria bacterium]|nr:hydroxyacid dehydrogenase [Deltaproteobacteria bacterium]